MRTEMFGGLGLGLGLGLLLVLWLILLGTLSRYYLAHSITPWMLSVRHRNHSVNITKHSCWTLTQTTE